MRKQRGEERRGVERGEEEARCHVCGNCGGTAVESEPVRHAILAKHELEKVESKSTRSARSEGHGC